jgi:hypothetical protein
MGPIVLELQKEALDREIAVSDLLRKAMVVARKLKIREFETWIGNELAGYSGDAREVPEYRRLTGQVKVFNRFQGWMPMTFEDPEHAQICSTRLCGQSAAELESLLGGKKSSMLMMPFPPEMEKNLMESMHPIALQPLLHVPASAIVGILDTVRNTVLNWALRLEEDGILGEGLAFSAGEQARASESKYHVTNFYGAVTNSQVAPGASAPSQIVVTSSINLDDVKALVAKVKRAASEIDLAPEQRNELSAELTTIDTQVASPKPKTGIIKQSLSSVRTILEGAGGNVVATLLVELAKALMS